MKKLKYLLVVCLMVVVAGCSSTPEGALESTPEDLYIQGYDAFQDKNYPVAVKAFDALEQQFPYSVWAERAQIMMAYASYMQNEYTDAIMALDRFIQLHPGNRNTPYAYYLKGLSYYEQKSDATREQQMSANARETFRDLLARYPNSIYATDARAKLDSIRDHLAGKEMDVGRYYLKRHDYIAAMNRFQAAIKNYPNSNQIPEAYYRLTAAYQSLGLITEAQKTSDFLIKKYPTSDWATRAQKIIK